jgi:hypothetical protein
MTLEEALQFLVAALRAVVPGFEVPRHEFRTGRDLWDEVVTTSRVAAMLVRDLEPEQQTTVQDVLTGMLRERFGDQAMTG